MFQSKKAEDAESESDWDSLPGDVQDPTSSPDVTPRYQPAPPRGSPHTHAPQKRPQVKPQAAVPTPEKSSATNSPVTKQRANPATPSNQRPSQMYGKPGVTNFVDRSLTATSFTDGGLESRLNKDLAPAFNDNRMQGQRSQVGREDGITLEMNEVDHNRNDPPFTDFQAALPKQEKQKAEWSEKPNKGKVKSSYFLTNNSQARHGDHSWDSSSEREEEPVSHSRQHLTETTSERKSRKALVEHSKDDGIVATDPDQTALQTCCVPMDDKRQITGYSYHFDHGHNHHLDVNPEWKEPHMKRFADRSEKWLHYFWQEFFSTLRIITDFAFIFVLELIKFVLHYVVLRVLGGLIMVIGDHLLKPYLAVVFNSFIQPMFIFSRNIFTGLKNVVLPLLDISRDFLSQIASLLRAFRLFELNWKPTFEGGRKHDVHVL